MVELADGARLYTEPMDDWNLAHARRVTFAELVGAARLPRRRGLARRDRRGLPRSSSDRLTKVSYAVGWSAWLDIAPQGVDKSTALEKVRTWLGIEPIACSSWATGATTSECSGGRSSMAAGRSRWARARRSASRGGETTASVHSGGVADILRAL
jgi:hypothetical protein